MARTFSIPEEPEGVTRIRTTDGEGTTFKLGPYHYAGRWVDADGVHYEWDEILRDFGEVEELPDPREAIEFFGKDQSADQLYTLYMNTPRNVLGEHLKNLVEFAEASL